jgi:hypothetical protein
MGLLTLWMHSQPPNETPQLFLFRSMRPRYASICVHGAQTKLRTTNCAHDVLRRMETQTPACLRSFLSVVFPVDRSNFPNNITGSAGRWCQGSRSSIGFQHAGGRWVRIGAHHTMHGPMDGVNLPKRAPAGDREDQRSDDESCAMAGSDGWVGRLRPVPNWLAAPYACMPDPVIHGLPL